MRDGVADVLAQRASLERGAGAGFLISAVVHGGLAAFAIYAAMQTTRPKPVGLVNITFAPMSAPAPASKQATAS